MAYFLFDIGNVLVDFEDHQLLDEIARAAGRPAEPLSDRDLEMHNAVETGGISDEEWVGYLNEAKGVGWDLPGLVRAWTRMFRVNEAGRGLFLDTVRAGVPVFTLSNIASHHIEAIASNWPGFFDGAAGAFLSYEMGIRKPDEGIFRKALDRLGAEGRQCFFIDDRPENVDAARSLGIVAHRFVPETHAAVRAAAAEFFGWA